jgi:two-component system sensor histidine kinase BaeS
MRRRFIVTLLVIVAAALGVAGVGSQLLVRRATLEDARRDLAVQAQQVRASDDLRRPAFLALLRDVLRLQGATIVRFGRSGAPLTALPPGVGVDDLRPATLAAGSTVSGTRGTLVYAAAPIPAQLGGTSAVVFTRRLNSLNRGVGFFALAALVSLALAAVVGSRLGRRITRPLEIAETTTRAMADGDLQARIDLPAGTDPEVASLAASITSLATNLERSRAAERDFLLSVSHDLRTPLTAIRGFGEALSDGAIDDPARAGGIITNEAHRLERLVGDLLELGRLGAGAFTLAMTTVRLDDVVGGTAEALAPAAASAGVTLTGPGPSDAAAQADPDRLAQVVANLLENALAYASSRVEVAVVQRDGRNGFVVDDDGPGIAGEEQAAVFARHYRSDRAQGRHIGTGLGLAIVGELVAAMGGTVTVTSPRPGDLPGTRFEVLLRPASSAATPSLPDQH